ncbi:cytochrome P450 [Mycena epipterygia]|nr:cytochrome P450 [Mycena epipterygia]
MKSSEIWVLGALSVWAAALLLRVGRREKSLPPGPSTVPLLGNAHLVGDAKTLYLKLTEWARTHGDIYSIKIVSTTMVVLSGPTAIKEVVDKHGWAASSRAENHMVDLCGLGPEFSLLSSSNSERLKELRRVLARFLSPQNSLKYEPAQAAESTLLLHDLITNPEDFTHSIRRYTHSLAKIMAYGQRAPSFYTPDVQSFYTSLDELLHVIAPGSYPPFELIPVLKYLPRPFAPWRAIARRIASVRTGLYTKMFDALQRRQALGDEESTECFIGKTFQAGVPAGEEKYYSYTGLSILDAGSDSTGAFLLSLVLVLATYPEVQARARAEIDAVVGGTQLPVLADFSKLPYLDALIKEILRFRPQFPIGIPHTMTTDATYKGYVVPKGSMVVLNTYGLFHDPEIFEDPEVFNPDRFLNSEHGTRPGMDTDFRDNLIFGGGRRICPGQFIAQLTMQVTTMRMIWAFKFSAATDAATGEPISRDLNCYVADSVLVPGAFKCTIEPRSAEHRDVVVQALDEAQQYLTRYEK